MNNTRFRQASHSSRSRQTGFSLVELIVSMVIGLTVVGAALAMYLSSGVSGRGSSALSQMTEDASIALSLLRSQVAMAGFAHPTGTNADGFLTKAYSGVAIFGCTGGATTATADGALSSMACLNDDTKPDSIVVLYQADTSNTVPNASTEPTDCIGTGITASGGISVAENRYFVDGTSLSCLGRGAGASAAAQPLVENIKDLKITYGVASTKVVGSTTVTKGVAERYLTAKQISAGSASESSAPLWNQVTSARICIVVRSEAPAQDDDPAPYFDCSGTSQSSSDKHLYRAFTTTVVLQNRIN